MSKIRSNFNGNKVRTAHLQPPTMLRDAQMAGLVKLHCGDRPETERQEWVGIDGAPGRPVCGMPHRRKSGLSRSRTLVRRAAIDPKGGERPFAALCRINGCAQHRAAKNREVPYHATWSHTKRIKLDLHFKFSPKRRQFTATLRP